MHRRTRRLCTLGDLVVAAIEAAAARTTDSEAIARLATRVVEHALAQPSNVRAARALQELVAVAAAAHTGRARVRAAA